MLVICQSIIQSWLNLSRHIQINQNLGIFSLCYNKNILLIIFGKISGKFSGNRPRVIFNQLSDAIFDKENYFSGNYE